MWESGTPTPPCSQKSEHHFIAGPPHQKFHICGFSRPWIIQYCGLCLLGKKKKAALSVDPCSSYPCCSRADCKLILSSPTHCRRYSDRKAKREVLLQYKRRGSQEHAEWTIKVVRWGAGVMGYPLTKLFLAFSDPKAGQCVVSFRQG